MTAQTTFVEPVRRRRRKLNKPEQIADGLNRLTDFYAVNKPGLKSVTISHDDAWSIREYWRDKEKQQIARMAGFNVTDAGEMSWRGFDLIEQA